MEIIFGLLIITAIIAGFLAGLLGIGGGIIIVPSLFAIFTYLDYADNKLMHVAVATALATTVFTTMSSVYSHYKHGAIDVKFFKMFAPAIICGVIVGTLIIDYISSDGLLALFGIMLSVFAILMFSDTSKLADRIGVIPIIVHWVIGCVIGVISTLLGIGGATLNVPYMVLNKLCIRNAVATASVFGMCVAVTGTIGFLYSGWGVETGIENTIGYIHYISFLIMIPITVLIAPYGAKTAHKIDVSLLRKLFAIVMMIVSLKMLYSSFV